jgi:hypothetical protein
MKKTQELSSVIWLILFWLYVAIPLCWGIASTLKKAMALFD